MAARTRYLLAYDIRDKRRLRRIHEVAKAWGYPLQYSVFICDLTKSDLLMMRRDLLSEMSTTQDSIGIFDLGPTSGRGVECIQILGQIRDLPSEGAGIW